MRLIRAPLAERCNPTVRSTHSVASDAMGSRASLRSNKRSGGAYRQYPRQSTSLAPSEGGGAVVGVLALQVPVPSCPPGMGATEGEGWTIKVAASALRLAPR